MPFSLTEFFGYAILCLPFFGLAKILSRNWSFYVKESLFIIAACLLFSIAINFELHISSTNDFSLRIVSNSVLLILFFVYFKWVQGLPFEKSLSLMTVAFLITLSSEILWQAAVCRIFPAYFDNYPIHFGYQGLLRSIPYASGLLAFFILFAIFFVWIAPKIQERVSSGSPIPVIWMSFSMIIPTLSLILLASWRYSIYQIDYLVIFVFFYLVSSMESFYFYTRGIQIRSNLHEKEAEQQNLQYYINEIENQQAAMRKFKHDYQNILFSLHAFIEEKDLEGLEHYYTNKIKLASEVITKNDFALESLSKIKVREIKGILAAKLMMAQNLGINTRFETDGEIDAIPTDSVSLVRMLGIILDNAIEELETLGEGNLDVGCFTQGNTVTFVVQNTCRPDIQTLFILGQAGFSTKGEGRGLGLTNLSDIAKNEPNINLRTTIKKGVFFQKLIIGGE